MMRYTRINLGYVVVLGAVCMTVGTITMAQSYSWIPLGSIASSWSVNGSHIYNSNAGSVLIGGQVSPDGSLLLDVNGQVGAVEYCDETGTSTNCFAPHDMQWRLSGTTQYTNNTGNVGIGTTNPTQKLDVEGNVIADAYFYSSDERLKSSIVPVEGMDVIGQLEGVRFEWTDGSGSSMGVIAQDVEVVLPELVHTDPVTGYKSVDYGGLIGPLVEAVKEQQQEIHELRILLERLRSLK